MTADKCNRCDGCGKIADSDDGEPWSVWLAMPLQSSAAVLMGLVKPIPCPACGGTGTSTEPDPHPALSSIYRPPVLSSGGVSPSPYEQPGPGPCVECMSKDLQIVSLVGRSSSAEAIAERGASIAGNTGSVKAMWDEHCAKYGRDL